jgi:ABC-type Co2+ transport system permease subunit
MLTFKRVLIATICGVVFGFVCLGLATSGPDAAPMSAAIKWNIVLSRTLLGFTIGISSIRLAWWLHGLVIGFITSIPMGLGVLASTASSSPMSPTMIAVSTVFMGLIYGVLTELITSVLLKAKPGWQSPAPTR